MKQSLALVAAIVATVFLPCAARPQALQRLTVDSFTLTSDTPHPQLEVPFHLILKLRVGQRVTDIENLVLPILAELELLGDERHYYVGNDGTEYRETITVVAHHTGTIVVAPATLQAVDARDGRAKQWYSNGLMLNVGGGGLLPLRRVERDALRVAPEAFRVVLWGTGVLCGLAILVLLFTHRPRPAAPPAAETTAPPVPVRPRSQREQLEDALTVLKAERTRSAAVCVRSAIWRMIGASDGETLEDVLQRSQARNARMRALLVALERAAFTYDEDLSDAIDGACIAIEHCLA
jgi:hypothetical protein